MLNRITEYYSVIQREHHFERTLSFRTKRDLCPSGKKIPHPSLRLGIRNDKKRIVISNELCHFDRREKSCIPVTLRFLSRASFEMTGQIDITMEWFGMTKRSCHFDRREKSWGVVKTSLRLRRIDMTKKSVVISSEERLVRLRSKSCIPVTLRFLPA